MGWKGKVLIYLGAIYFLRCFAFGLCFFIDSQTRWHTKQFARQKMWKKDTAINARCLFDKKKWNPALAIVECNYQNCTNKYFTSRTPREGEIKMSFVADAVNNSSIAAWHFPFGPAMNLRQLDAARHSLKLRWRNHLSQIGRDSRISVWYFVQRRWQENEANKEIKLIILVNHPFSFALCNLWDCTKLGLSVFNLF